MPTAETAPVEPVANTNRPNLPKQNQTLMAFLLIVFLISSLSIVYLLKNPNLNFNRIIKNSPTAKSKIEISSQELTAALELEKTYQQSSISSSLLSSPSAKATLVSIESLARQRITENKILEIEGQKLGLNIAQIKRGSLPVLVTREGVTLSATPSASLYGYERSLKEAVKEKVEGYVEKQILAVVFLVPKLATEAQKTASDILPLIKEDRFDSQSYLKERPLDKDLSFFSQIVRDPLKIYLNPTKLPAIGEVKIVPTPYSFDIEKISKIEKGLGLSFEEWYQNVKKKYL